MKIVIEMLDDDYNFIMDEAVITPRSLNYLERRVVEGVPLENVLKDIKTEIYQRSCRNYGSGFGHGLNVALEIIDRHIGDTK